VEAQATRKTKRNKQNRQNFAHAMYPFRRSPFQVVPGCRGWDDSPSQIVVGLFPVPDWIDRAVGRTDGVAAATNSGAGGAGGFRRIVHLPKTDPSLAA